MAQTLQEWRFGLPQQVKNQDQLRCLLKANIIKKKVMEESSDKYQLWPYDDL